MKYLTILIFIIFFSCENKKSKPDKIENNINASRSFDTTKKTIPFFVFDEIIHYHISDSLNMDWTRIMHKENKTKEESKFMDIFMRHYPESITDKQFTNDLEKFYTNKKEIDPKHFAAINDIYSEKFYGDYSLAACVPYYRDILIFKKNKIIVGISKICFECYLHQTLGTARNTEQLGQKGDYEKLDNILRHQ